ncbi:TldD/PmbA family protein [Acidithrix ferrooxidans]|uniref:Metalloprotease PmbA n=1 Tax=Acidithrix ferrooxidans TaxID=1280514 RepID=A0A0D8HGQ0_9ACTN|nr:TldD/PmbA family protein [Acidithrix ferrooxidans]KJF17024.1 metalloprotease PmbA [Acidithrix ferrooxidans]
MPDLIKIGQRIADMASGGEEIEAYAIWERETSIRVYNSEIESLTTSESSGIGIRVIRDKRVGISYAGTLEDDDLKRALEEARDNSRFASQDPFAGIAEPDGVDGPKLNLWSVDITNTPTENKISLALELEKVTLSKDRRIKSLNSSNYGDVSVESAIVNSKGIASYTQQTYCWLWAYALAMQDDETQTGFGLHASRDFAGIDLEYAAQEAAYKSTRMLGAKKPKSSNLIAVFEPDISSSFIGIISSTLSAEAVQKGRSIFSGRVGENVANSRLNLIDDPSDPRFFSSANYDDEGLASRQNLLIKNGSLKGYLYDSYTARKEGVAPTGSAIRGGIAGSCSPGPRAPYIEPGERSKEEIVSEITDGVLIQSVSGIHSGVNPVSGDFSVGAEGIRIHDGELKEPIKEFTIASNLQKMLLDIRSIGSDLTIRPSGAAGVTLAIGNINLSGS